ncbi:hypothetical protein AAJ76_162000219, partial [Vairimorpha ceranae]
MDGYLSNTLLNQRFTLVLIIKITLKDTKKTNFNRFSSMEVENKTREITPLYKKGHAVSHDEQKSSKKENKKIK